MELIRPQAAYVVKDVPVYGEIGFTLGSKDFLNLPRAMEFARESGGFLQSIGHAIVVRAAFHEDNEKTNRGLDGSDDFQKTSTVSIKYRDGEGLHSAFTELPNEPASYELVNAGYKAARHNHPLIMPCTSPLVARLIKQAQDAGRIRPPHKANRLQLSIGQAGGCSEYSKNKDIIAVVGNAQIAELDASYLQKVHRKYGFLCDFTESEIEKMLGGKDGQALIRTVGIGGNICHRGYIDDFSVASDFPTGGRARGTVHAEREISLEKIASESRA